MQISKNILVGVDLVRCKPPDVSGLHGVAWEAISRGIKIARDNSARLLFFAAASTGDEVLSPLDEEDRAQVRSSVGQAGARILDELVKKAQAQGVAAQSKLVAGKAWREIIREVLRGKHDLVVVGTRHVNAIRRMLFGNTALKLLHCCPCPVLVARVGSDASAPNILAAVNLKPSSQDVLRLAIGLAEQTNARLHVLHVVGQQLDDVCSIGLPDAKQAQYRQKVRAHAEELLHAQLEKTGYQARGNRVEIHLAESIKVGVPDVAIQHFVQVNRIQLLVMGNVGRSGLRGIMIGNTAERLFPEVQCSVLVVKPADFVCPIEE